MKISKRILAACLSCLLISGALSGCKTEGDSSQTESDAAASTGSTGTEPTTGGTLAPDKYSPKCEVDDVVYNTGLCISEWGTYYNDTAMNLKKRFELYKEVGFKTIRVETGWGAIEKSRGVYTNPANVLYYYLSLIHIYWRAWISPIPGGCMRKTASPPASPLTISRKTCG